MAQAGAPPGGGSPGGAAAAAAAAAAAPRAGGADDGADGGRPSGAPLRSPPGLEAEASDQQASATCRAIAIEAVKRELARDVDTKVGQKVDELWMRGQRMLAQMQKKQQENTERLSAEIAKCLEKQKTLEADNEQLKQVLLTLAQRLTILGAAFGAAAAGAPAAAAAASASGAAAGAGPAGATTPGGGAAAPAAPAGGGGGAAAATAATPLAPSRTSAASPLGGPRGSPGAAGEARPGDRPLGLPGMPEVPAFPFPAASGPPSTPGCTPLSLAEALAPGGAAGAGTPDAGGAAAGAGGAQPVARAKQALSLANSLPAAQPLEVFSFTIRKADETDLGLNVSHCEDDKVLCVEGIRADGAVESWNRQCSTGAKPENVEKIVVAGDKIICVNSVVYDPARMLEECKEKQLLRLTIWRGKGPLPEAETLVGGAGAAVGAPAPRGPSAMRAEASEFVPRAGPAAAPAAPAPAAAVPKGSSSGASACEAGSGAGAPDAAVGGDVGLRPRLPS